MDRLHVGQSQCVRGMRHEADLLTGGIDESEPTRGIQQREREAGEAGLGTSFTCIVGLDDMEPLQSGIASLVPYVSEFPNFQVYQAHNAIMAGFRAAGADHLEFYLKARTRIEVMLGPPGLRPAGWEGYRSLWYFTFAGESLVAA